MYTWLALLKNLLLLGIYESFPTGDMALLNNALTQGTRHSQNGAVYASGVDHSLYTFNVLWSCWRRIFLSAFRRCCQKRWD